MIFSGELFFYPSKNYLFIYTQLFENLKGRILKSITAWSEMGQQTAQLEKDCVIVQIVLLSSFFFSFYFLNALQSDNNNNRDYVLEDKYVLGPSQSSF